MNNSTWFLMNSKKALLNHHPMPWIMIGDTLGMYMDIAAPDFLIDYDVYMSILLSLFPLAMFFSGVVQLTTTALVIVFYFNSLIIRFYRYSITTNATLDFIVASNSRAYVCGEGTTWMLYPTKLTLAKYVQLYFSISERNTLL